MAEFFHYSHRADTPVAAQERLRDLYGDIKVEGVGDYHDSATGDERFSISKVALGGEFDIGGVVGDLTFCFSTPGHRWCSEDGDEDGLLSAAPALLRPNLAMTSRSEGRVQVTSVTFDTAQIQRFANAVYAAETPLVFVSGHPVSKATGRAWVRTVTALDALGPLDNDLMRASAYRLLALSAFELFRLRGDREARTTSAEAGLHAYRHAVQFIEDNMSLPVTEADIAHAAQISEAELRLVFQGHDPLERTPGQHLRHARLAAAHHDLIAGDPTSGDTVARIAARWGFSSPSRFAQLHRSTYRINPKWVLDR